MIEVVCHIRIAFEDSMVICAALEGILEKKGKFLLIKVVVVVFISF